MSNLLWMLSAPTDEALKEDVETLFKDNIWPYLEIVLWVLVAALAAVLIVKGVMTALAVVKAADEPQVRQEKIAAFKYLAIGLGAGILIIALATTIVGLVLDNAETGDLAKLPYAGGLF